MDNGPDMTRDPAFAMVQKKTFLMGSHAHVPRAYMEYRAFGATAGLTKGLQRGSYIQ